MAGQTSAPVATKKPQRKPVENIHIDELLELVVENNASDLHLAADLPPVLRIDGELKMARYELASAAVIQRVIYDILSDDQIQRFETQLELDCSYAMRKIARFRVNVFRERGNVAAAFRLIPTQIPTTRELGLPPIMEELARKRRGLLLSTGPTGCGKSTSQAALIDQINRERAEHVITI